MDRFAECCPLCGNNHPPEFHGFAPRTYRKEQDEGEPEEGKEHLRAPRLICRENKRRREKSGKPLQYTVTILPGFLISYSTILVDAVHRGLDSYLGKQTVTQTGAALKMGCRNPRSFRLFYLRASRRMYLWTGLLMQLVTMLGGTLSQEQKTDGKDQLHGGWMWFSLLGEEYLRLYGRVPEGVLILQALQDCFRRAVLRWGLPDRLYCDNGRVYISKHFLLMVSELSIKKLHHPAYSAWCKGKIENIMKRYKSFQGEAQIAGIQTIEELNATLAAWTEVEYNNKIHSATGETPNQRWRNNLSAHPPRRITDLEAFNELFLWRAERTIDKFATIRFQRNSYRINALAVGTTVQLRYNPFDLAEVHVYHKGAFHCILKASTLNRKAVPEVPEERNSHSYSPEAADYFKRIREKANDMMRRQAEQIRYSDLQKEQDS